MARCVILPLLMFLFRCLYASGVIMKIDAPITESKSSDAPTETPNWLLLPHEGISGADKLDLKARAKAAEESTRRLSNVGSALATTISSQIASSRNRDSMPRLEGSLRESGGKLFFLFLTYQGINRLDIWQSFFADSSASQHRSFLHCKDRTVCASALLTNGNTLNLTLIESVPSEYCNDLVTPLVALLRAATVESTSVNDKFLIISETTLPIKPFQHIFDTLTGNRESDFCLIGSAPLKTQIPGDFVLYKHSQWVILSQAHAKVLVDRWPRVHHKEGQLPWTVPIATNQALPTNSNYSAVPVDDHFNRWCNDEWIVFATVFGAIDMGGNDQQSPKTVPGLSDTICRAPSNFIGNAAGICQKKIGCRTFASWTTTDLISKLKADTPSTQFGCGADCRSASPMEIKRISDYGLTLFRQSDYLFARKFAADAIAVNQFEKMILDRTNKVPHENDMIRRAD